MEGSRAQLPSGRWTDDPALTTLESIRHEEAAWLVARYMFSHSVNGEYRGSVGSAMKMIWPGQWSDSVRRGITGGLKTNGFIPVQRQGYYVWMIPAVFPAWQKTLYSSDDDGSQTTGGPVTVRRQAKPPKPHEVWTKQMIALAKAIEANPGLHPREYAELLDWSGVTWVAQSLRNHGYIISRGERTACRYYPTEKPWPARLRIKREAAPPAPPPPPPEPVVEPVAEPILETAPLQIAPQPAQEPAAATNGAKKVYHLTDGFYIVTGHVERLEVTTLADA